MTTTMRKPKYRVGNNTDYAGRSFERAKPVNGGLEP